jgi:hypothetical protein
MYSRLAGRGGIDGDPATDVVHVGAGIEARVARAISACVAAEAARRSVLRDRAMRSGDRGLLAPLSACASSCCSRVPRRPRVCDARRCRRVDAAFSAGRVCKMTTVWSSGHRDRHEGRYVSMQAGRSKAGIAPLSAASRATVRQRLHEVAAHGAAQAPRCRAEAPCFRPGADTSEVVDARLSPALR